MAPSVCAACAADVSTSSVVALLMLITCVPNCAPDDVAVDGFPDPRRSPPTFAATTLEGRLMSKSSMSI